MRDMDTARICTQMVLPEGKRDKQMNSLAYEIVWARNTSLFFKEFQNGRPNWEAEGLKSRPTFPVLPSAS